MRKKIEFYMVSIMCLTFSATIGFAMLLEVPSAARFLVFAALCFLTLVGLKIARDDLCKNHTKARPS